MNTSILASELVVGDLIVTVDGNSAMRVSRVFVSTRKVITVLEDMCPKDFDLDTPLVVVRAVMNELT